MRISNKNLHIYNKKKNTKASCWKTYFLDDEIQNSQPISLPSSSNTNSEPYKLVNIEKNFKTIRPQKFTGECGGLRSIEEIDPKYRNIFNYQYFNLVQTKVIEDALYSDKSMVVCAPTGSGKTVIFEMAIVQLLMEMDDRNGVEDFKIIYMAPIKALCTERLTEWYPKFTKLNLLCIEVTGDTDVDFSQLKPYRIIITTPEKWDMLTRRWRDNRAMVELIKLFLIDEVHILNEPTRGPVLEAVVSRMKAVQTSMQSAHRIEQLQKLSRTNGNSKEIETLAPKIRFVAVSATISNPEDVAEWLGTSDKPAVYYKFGDECRPVKLKRVVEGYPCPEGTSIFKFDIILNYKLWPIIQKYHNGKPTLIFCNTRKSVLLTAETLSREITINFSPEQRAKLVAVASVIKNKKVQSLVTCGVGCHHAGLLFEERTNIEQAFRKGDLPILITTTTLAMGVNLPAHLVIIKNTQQYMNGAYQEYSISTVLQMVGRAGRPQFDTEATAVIMTRLADKGRYQALVGGCEPLQSYLHKRLAENLNSEAALCTVNDVAQCVQWLRSTFLFVRAARDPKKYLGLPQTAAPHLISKKIEELCVKAMNGLASSGLITMDEASCIESTEAGRLMSIFYLDLETMKHIMKIKGDETLEQLLWIVCESHELSDMHLRVDERRCLNALNRNNAAATVRFPMKGKIATRQMKLNCIIQAVLGCLPIHEPSLNQESIKIMRIADRICKCLVAYVTRPDQVIGSPRNYQAVLNSIVLAKCIESHLWENSVYVSKQLKGIGPTFSTLLATAGKSNFMLLEESHPRDLERIMNKGPPTGNILRKQISLLPKYQFTITAGNSSTLIIKLTLLNKAYLAENMDHLTAGVNHKCYIIIGDTENCLLLLTTFKDKDLIGIYDGQITLNITRIHNFDHKITAHCISSSFVGIDVHCEYKYKDLNASQAEDTGANSPKEIKSKGKNVKQSAITDTFKVRKRKKCDADVKSVEKKKCYDVRDNSEYLQQILEDTYNGRVNSEINSYNYLEKQQREMNIANEEDLNTDEKENRHNIKNIKSKIIDEINKDDFEDDNQINCILKEIEREIYGKDWLDSQLNAENTQSNKIAYANKNVIHNDFSYKNRKIAKSNFNFIDGIERKFNTKNNNEEVVIDNKKNSFVDSVKGHIDMFLEKTKVKTKISEHSVVNLLEIEHNEEIGCKSKTINNETEKKSETIVVNQDDVALKIFESYNNAPNICTGSSKEVKNKILDLKISPEESTGKITNSVSINGPNGRDEILKKQENNNNILGNFVNIPGTQSAASKSEKTLAKSINDNAAYYLNSIDNVFYNRVVQQVINEKNIFRSNTERSASFTYTKTNNFDPIFNSYYNIFKDGSFNGNHIKCNISKTTYMTNIPNHVFEHNPPVRKFPSAPSIYSANIFTFDQVERIDKRKFKCNVKLDLEYLTAAGCNNTFETYVCDDLSNALSEEITCNKKNPTKCHLNVKNALEQRYSIMRQIKLDFDITEIGTSVKHKNDLHKHKQNEYDNEIKPANINLIQSQCHDSCNSQIPLHETYISDDIRNNNPRVIEKKDLEQDLASENKIVEITDYAKQEESASCGHDNRSIYNIIEKYKNIMSRKPSAIKETDYRKKLTTTSNAELPQNEKIKRPFKITDLPSLQEPNWEFQNSQVEPQMPIYFTSEIRKDLKEDKTNVTMEKYEDNEEEKYEDNCTENADIEYLLQPKFEQTNLLNDDLTQSMFNPKTVLQCLKQEDIIPPPSQFRDDYSSYCQNKILYDMEAPSTTNIKQDFTLKNLNRNFNNGNKKSVKQSSKEVETWTLACDDVHVDNYKSFDIIRNNSCINFRPQVIVRKAKLNEFKFSRKNVFKYRK